MPYLVIALLNTKRTWSELCSRARINEFVIEQLAWGGRSLQGARFHTGAGPEQTTIFRAMELDLGLDPSSANSVGAWVLPKFTIFHQ